VTAPYVRTGTDTSGRPILMTPVMRDWWTDVLTRLDFTPVIVQGAWMKYAGGGATASAGYHDEGGCLDLRVWDLTEKQRSELIRTLREMGAAAWIRDAAHGGMDPHCHLVLGVDQPKNDGAAWQWQQYLDGRDGLSAGGRDYHWRPNPLVTTPPEDDMTPDQDKTLSEIAATVTRLEKRGIRQTQRVMAAIRAARKQVKASDTQVLAALDDVEKALADDA
jgi:hypothetical protein